MCGHDNSLEHFCMQFLDEIVVNMHVNCPAATCRREELALALMVCVNKSPGSFAKTNSCVRPLK